MVTDSILSHNGVPQISEEGRVGKFYTIIDFGKGILALYEMARDGPSNLVS